VAPVALACWRLGLGQRTPLDGGLPASPKIAVRPLLSAARSGVMSALRNLF